jgi:glutathione S-transferase
MRLFHSPGACSLAPHIVLEELGAPYTLELVSVAEGRTQSPDYLRINPKGRVPALAVGDELLTEAPAILLYLAMQAGGALYPADPMQQARALEWFNWLSGTLHTFAFGQLWRAQRFTAEPSQVDGVIAKGRENIAETFAMIEQKLAGRTWAVGDAYSVVDPYLLVFFRWGNRIGTDMQAQYPAWTAHARRVLERPAVQRALEQEGISVWS